ncbi:hypothetical protein L6452_32265 [Arctium lappa]|uniref:Uncharacterized protein n=1 Tax=Arctium lappa TaxID=4217 RepID=A0ACB8Z450_ARCLA|nr:hypothetical protein L6452_32265 [Arctium lappa]
MSYTSSNTFLQRNMAEMDVFKIAYFAIMQNSKNDALHLILKIAYVAIIQKSKNVLGLNEVKTESGTIPMPESSAFLPPVITQPSIPQVSNEVITPTVPRLVVLMQTPSAEINNSFISSVVAESPCLGEFSSILATPGFSSNVI